MKAAVKIEVERITFRLLFSRRKGRKQYVHIAD